MAERMQKLLFEMSNEDRMRILRRLEENSLNLSQLADSQDLHVSDAFRHLHRLSDAGLVQKDGEGQYHLTHYGQLILGQLKGIEALTKNEEYFSKCSTSMLPYEFISRIGELVEGTALATIPDELNAIEGAIKMADQYIWAMSSHNLNITNPQIIAKAKAGVNIRFIAPEGIYLPDSVAPIPTTLPGINKRELKKVEIMILVTDHVAGFGLPTPDGKLLTHSLVGTERRFMKWCEDLFKYYWERARPYGQ
ncbi:hypothetical protein DSECCO2_481130 [anaerobic digester metagenome]|jgi:predicted transcriptional regulator